MTLLGAVFLLAAAVVYLIVKQHRLHRLSKKQSSLHPNHHRRRSGQSDRS